MGLNGDQLNQFKKKRLDAIYFIISGFLFPVIGLVVYVLMDDLEKGKMSQVSGNKIVILLYKTIGNNGTLAVFSIAGLLCLIWGIYKFISLKKLKA